MRVHARDKRKWFAVHFGNGYTQSPPLNTPSLAFGLGLALLTVFIVSTFVIGYGASSGVALAVTPLLACVDRASELQKQIDQKMSELEAIKKKAADDGNRLLTDEERTACTAITKEVRALAANRDLEQEEAETRDAINTSFRPPTRPQVESEDELQRRFPGLPSKEKRFANLGDFTSAVINADPRIDGRVDSRLLRVATGMGEANPADGGFAVQPDQSSRLIEPLFSQNGDGILSRLNTTPVTGDGVAFNAVDETSRASTSWGGIAMYWLGEGATKTPSAPKLRRVELKLKKIAGLCYLTDELMQDAPALASRVERGFRNALRSALIRAIVRGTGAGQPLGLLNSSAKIAVAAETGQLAATINADNIDKMVEAMDPDAVNPVWLYNRNSCYRQLHQLQIALGTAGDLVNMPSGGYAVAPNTTLAGFPLIPCPWCSVLGTEGDIMFVDLGQYEFITKGAEQIAYSIHVKFIYDETAMRIVYRCDGRPAVISAVTLEDGTSTASPIVTLATRS